MKPSLKHKWVTALLSGEFKQANGELFNGLDSYCCLGVLRCVADPKDNRSSGGHGTLLSSTQLKEFGITAAEQNALASLNDSGVPFDAIAGFIEETL